MSVAQHLTRIESEIKDVRRDVLGARADHVEVGKSLDALKDFIQEMNLHLGTLGIEYKNVVGGMKKMYERVEGVRTDIQDVKLNLEGRPCAIHNEKFKNIENRVEAQSKENQKRINTQNWFFFITLIGLIIKVVVD